MRKKELNDLFNRIKNITDDIGIKLQYDNSSEYIKIFSRDGEELFITIKDGDFILTHKDEQFVMRSIGEIILKVLIWKWKEN